MDLDAPFDLTESTIPPPVVERAERRLERFALEVLTLTETAVVSVVDVIGDEARSTIVGHAPLPDGEEEVLLELWLQEVCVTSLRRVPSLLRALLPASTASVVPVTTPSGFSLSVAMTPPCTSPALSPACRPWLSTSCSSSKRTSAPASAAPCPRAVVVPAPGSGGRREPCEFLAPRPEPRPCLGGAQRRS